MPATQAFVPVRAWPQNQHLALADLRSSRALTVISVPTPATTNRLLARDLVRLALRQTLAAFLGQPVASITLVSHPGLPIRVDAPLARLHVSVSHMPGMSVAAISNGSGVGIDAMHVDYSAAGMADLAHVARDYLGPAVSDELQRLAPAQGPSAFAEAWTHQEARLKCLGMALTEWTPALQAQLAPCPATRLALPENYRGAVAWCPRQGATSRP